MDFRFVAELLHPPYGLVEAQPKWVSPLVEFPDICVQLVTGANQILELVLHDILAAVLPGRLQRPPKILNDPCLASPGAVRLQTEALDTELGEPLVHDVE